MVDTCGGPMPPTTARERADSCCARNPYGTSVVNGISRRGSVVGAPPKLPRCRLGDCVGRKSQSPPCGRGASRFASERRTLGALRRLQNSEGHGQVRKAAHVAVTEAEEQPLHFGGHP